MVLNPNENIVGKINKGLEKTGGYCPCRLTRTNDDICKCKEMKEEGKCICKLYVNVFIYGGTWCPHCTKLKYKLDILGISYQFRNIDENDEWRQEIIDKGFMTIPILKIGDLYLDPSKDEYMKYLKEE